MTKQDSIKVFADSRIRTIWDSDVEKWYISIVDAITVLTESVDPTAYWRKLKQRLKAEGNQTVTNCHALKMRAEVLTRQLNNSISKITLNIEQARELSKLRDTLLPKLLSGEFRIKDAERLV